ncbi:MAG: hypothetical protein II942_04225 [Alphaproteobacteria bacterium]|nr:hypothetical protein [Alphaproteobacteria bacterium]
MLKEVLRKASNNGMPDEEKMEKIVQILAQMDELMDCEKNGDAARFERSRKEFVSKFVQLYMPNATPEEIEAFELQFSFSLSAEDIMNKTMREIVGYDGPVNPNDADGLIDKKVGRGTIGCTGTAKLFCALAKKAGLNCSVVLTADYNSWNAAKQSEDPDKVISGHQLIAVEMSDGMHIFDPGYKEENVTYGAGYVEERQTKFKDLGSAEVGDFVDMPRMKNHFVTAILTPEEFEKVDSYDKLGNLYKSGNMDNPNFEIGPKGKAPSNNMLIQYTTEQYE